MKVASSSTTSRGAVMSPSMVPRTVTAPTRISPRIRAFFSTVSLPTDSIVPSTSQSTTNSEPKVSEPVIETPWERMAPPILAEVEAGACDGCWEIPFEGSREVAAGGWFLRVEENIGLAPICILHRSSREDSRLAEIKIYVKTWQSFDLWQVKIDHARSELSR